MPLVNNDNTKRAKQSFAFVPNGYIHFSPWGDLTPGKYIRKL